MPGRRHRPHKLSTAASLPRAPPCRTLPSLVAGLPFLNFQQLRSVRETVRQGFNLTLVAQALHTSQPGVSRQLKELEDELGIELFVRAGRRLLGLTPPGQARLVTTYIQQPPSALRPEA